MSTLPGYEIEVTNNVTDDNKFCGSCEQVKPLSEFHKHKNQAKGVQYHCKTCRNDKLGKSYSTAARVIMNKLGYKRPDLGTPCAICSRTDTKLIFDHCHKTDEFRGWICLKCNFRLGQLGDDPKIIREEIEKIINYLSRLSNV